VNSPRPTFPAKLRRGDTVRVVAPARSRALVAEHDHSAVIDARFAEMGLRLTYGEHVDERDDFDSSTVASRVTDLHAAFADPGVAAILTVIGGFNSNELLPHLNWELVAANPTILCGYSDITALQNAILARAGLVTYSGPHWSTFGMRDHFDQTLQWFTKALFEGDQPIELRPADTWTDDLWFLDQDDRRVHPNEGWWPLRTGSGTGRLVGGNLCSLNLLQGTEYMPSLDGTLVMVEDDATSTPATFARDLTSLLQLPDANGVRGLLVGRFQQDSGMTRDLLEQIIARQDRLDRLAGVPVLANVDFGHTSPLATLPIGGRAALTVGDTSTLTLIER
jgi:muramoyltetrapeptide carboxypeptidase